MFRFLLLPLTVPAGRLVRRVPRLTASILTPRDSGTPNDPNRRDSLRAVVGFPLALFFLSAAVASGTPGCASSQSSQLAVSQVDSFTIGHTSEDGMTLQEALVARAREQGITLAWHQSRAPDQVDAATSVEGLRLVRWDYREGSSTDARHYLFEVYQEDGEQIGNEPTLNTILHRGYMVVVLEVSSVTA